MSDWFDAAERGNLNKIKKMLHNNNSLLHSRSHDRETAIIKASENGHLNVVKYLLKKGANVNDMDETSLKQSPLILATFEGHENVVKTLLKRGANIHYKNNMGDNALITSIQEGKINVTKILLDNGANINEPNNDDETPLELATKYSGKGDTKMRDLLLSFKGGKRTTRKLRKTANRFSRRNKYNHNL
jgi:ankyrin repeat protein